MTIRNANPFILLVLLVPAVFLHADGVIIIDPPVPFPDRPAVRYTPLSVKYHKVRADISGGIAVTLIDQEFYNPNDAQLEGTYIFPLPERAAISKFSLFINGVETQGEMLDAEKARGIYEDIVRRMKDPALLEYAGRRMFKARVFPIPALGTRRVKIEYSETVQSDGGLYSYTYPLNTEKFSSSPLGEVVVEVNLSAGSPIRTIYCPTHKAEVVKVSETSARVVYEQTNALPDRDLSVLYGLQEGGDPGMSLATYMPPAGDGYYLAMITPSFGDDVVNSAKDVVFVFDTSGSMSGEKMDQAKHALAFCLQSLKQGDRFGLVTFSTEVRSFRNELAEQSPGAVKEALAFVEGMSARGGTNISEALSLALSLGGEKRARPFHVLFLTDGKPTLGLQDEQELVSAVKSYNTCGARVFVFGVGYDVNAVLVDRIAEDNGGSRTYVAPEEDIEIKVSGLFTKIESPVLSDVSVVIEGLNAYDVYPGRIGDLFKGSQVELLGRYAGTGEHTVRLTGTMNGGRKEYVFKRDFTGRTPAGETIARLWATRKIYYLLDEIRLHGVKDELKDEVVRLSREFGIMTPYTSFLVLEDERQIGAGAPAMSSATAIRNADSASGGAGSAVSEERMEAEQAVYGKARSGRGAFDAGREIDLKKEAPQYDEDRDGTFRGEGGRKLIRNTGGRTFYFNGTVWIDAAYDGKAETRKLAYLSGGYFLFLRENPSCGTYCALGTDVVFFYKGEFYQVVGQE